MTLPKEKDHLKRTMIITLAITIAILVFGIWNYFNTTNMFNTETKLDTKIDWTCKKLEVVYNETHNYIDHSSWMKYPESLTEDINKKKMELGCP